MSPDIISGAPPGSATELMPALAPPGTDAGAVGNPLAAVFAALLAQTVKASAPPQGVMLPVTVKALCLLKPQKSAVAMQMGETPPQSGKDAPKPKTEEMPLVATPPVALTTVILPPALLPAQMGQPRQTNRNVMDTDPRIASPTPGAAKTSDGELLSQTEKNIPQAMPPGVRAGSYPSALPVSITPQGVPAETLLATARLVGESQPVIVPSRGAALPEPAPTHLETAAALPANASANPQIQAQTGNTPDNAEQREAGSPLPKAPAASSVVALPQSVPKAAVQSSSERVTPAPPGANITRDSVPKPSQGVSAPTEILAPSPLPAPMQAAPKEAAAVMPAPDRAQMLEQVTSHIQQLQAQTTPGGQNQVVLNLHPKEWGQLQVTVSIPNQASAPGDAPQAVIAHILAENPVVKMALENHTAELRQALHETGLHLDKLIVTVQAASAAPEGGGAQTGSGDARSGQNPAGQPSFSPGGQPDGGASGGSSRHSFAHALREPGGFAPLGVQDKSSETLSNQVPLSRTSGVDTRA